MIGRPASRIGVDVYPVDGPATGSWRLSEVYNESRFRFWPPEFISCQSTLNLTTAGVFVDLVGATIKFSGYKLHTTNHIKFATYKLSGGVLS